MNIAIYRSNRVTVKKRVNRNFRYNKKNKKRQTRVAMVNVKVDRLCFTIVNNCSLCKCSFVRFDECLRAETFTAVKLNVFFFRKSFVRTIIFLNNYGEGKRVNEMRFHRENSGKNVTISD